MVNRTWAVAMLAWYLDGDELALMAMRDATEERVGSELARTCEDCLRILRNDPVYVAGLNPELWELAGRARP